MTHLKDIVTHLKGRNASYPAMLLPSPLHQDTPADSSPCMPAERLSSLKSGAPTGPASCQQAIASPAALCAPSDWAGAAAPAIAQQGAQAARPQPGLPQPILESQVPLQARVEVARWQQRAGSTPPASPAGAGEGQGLSAGAGGAAGSSQEQKPAAAAADLVPDSEPQNDFAGSGQGVAGLPEPRHSAHKPAVSDQRTTQLQAVRAQGSEAHNVQQAVEGGADMGNIPETQPESFVFTEHDPAAADGSGRQQQQQGSGGEGFVPGGSAQHQQQPSARQEPAALAPPAGRNAAMQGDSAGAAARTSKPAAPAQVPTDSEAGTSSQPAAPAGAPVGATMLTTYTRPKRRLSGQSPVAAPPAGQAPAAGSPQEVAAAAGSDGVAGQGAVPRQGPAKRAKSVSPAGDGGQAQAAAHPRRGPSATEVQVSMLQLGWHWSPSCWHAAGGTG